jgi:hypothetical protein
VAISIEIAVSENTSTTAKGRLLERLGYDILEAMQYTVVQEIRITGMEVDLAATHKISNEEIFVECKAYRDNISADVLTKLVGNIMFKSNVSSGWLLTTGPLGKDAKGLMKEWEEQPAEKRRKLQIYTPERLIDLLISSGRICSIESIKKPSNILFSENACLLITDKGQFWAQPLANAQVGIPYAVMLFDIKSGEPIIDPELIESVSKMDSSLRELEWIAGISKETPKLLETLNEEFQNIVNVSGGDQWADYRPSRPQDFVGRKELQDEVFKLLESIRDGISRTRLLALKAPSGWGKSSVLLKLIDRSKNKYHRSKYFIYAVDVRAATSQRYGEFSLLTCLKAAVDTGFAKKPSQPITITSTSNPFSDPSVIELLENLRVEGKVIALFFDQFEEIFSKKELSSLFESIRSLSMAVDGAQDNIVLGFAWKTDGTIPADHPAYYMWHSLADRRHEFTLTPFSTEDLSKALSIFSKELNAPLNPILRKHLMDHSQGYPWLLKKLCIHVYSLIRNNIDQVEILGRGLSIAELFERDLSELSPAEISCVKRIAPDSPADFFKIVEFFGGDTVQSLINRRLVLRKGDRLILYWDIFRDYVLTGSVPHIPLTYIPQTYFYKYYHTLKSLINSNDGTISAIAKTQSIGLAAAENISRDLVMVGNAERHGYKLIMLQATEADAIKKIMQFMNNHMLLKYLVSELGIGFSITQSEFYSKFREVYESAPYSEKTFATYTKRMMGWLRGLGLVDIKGNTVVHVGINRINLSRTNNGKLRPRQAYFLGEAPPKRVVEVCRLISEGTNDEELLQSLGYRNAISVLFALDGLVNNNGKLKLNFQYDQLVNWLFVSVQESETIQYIRDCIDLKKSGIEIGRYVQEKLGKSWTEASQKRYGGGLLRWYKWVLEQSDVESNQLVLNWD